MLATSRTPLRVEGERLWAVPPLSLPADGAPPRELVESDAVHLSVEQGCAVDPSFALDTGNARAVLEVCRRLDGLSLAIEMKRDLVGGKVVNTEFYKKERSGYLFVKSQSWL